MAGANISVSDEHTASCQGARRAKLTQASTAKRTPGSPICCDHRAARVSPTSSPSRLQASMPPGSAALPSWSGMGTTHSRRGARAGRVAMVVENAHHPFAPRCAVGAVRQDGRILERNVDLVVKAVRHPALYLGA